MNLNTMYYEKVSFPFFKHITYRELSGIAPALTIAGIIDKILIIYYFKMYQSNIFEITKIKKIYTISVLMKLFFCTSRSRGSMKAILLLTFTIYHYNYFTGILFKIFIHW